MHFNKQAKEVLVIRFQDSDCRQCKQLQRQFRFQQKKTFNNTHHSVRKQYYSKILPRSQKKRFLLCIKKSGTHTCKSMPVFQGIVMKTSLIASPMRHQSQSAGRASWRGKKKFKVLKGTLKDLAMEYLHTCVHDASVSTLQDFHYITVRWSNVLLLLLHVHTTSSSTPNNLDADGGQAMRRTDQRHRRHPVKVVSYVSHLLATI
jgi:hypothetical protein